MPTAASDDAERPGPRLERPRSVGECDEQCGIARGQARPKTAPSCTEQDRPAQEDDEAAEESEDAADAGQDRQDRDPGRTRGRATRGGGCRWCPAGRSCRGRGSRSWVPGAVGPRAPWTAVASDPGVSDRSSDECLPVRIVVGSVRGPRAEPHPSDRNAPDKPIFGASRPRQRTSSAARRSISRASTHRPSRMRWYWRIRPTGRKPTLA